MVKGNGFAPHRKLWLSSQAPRQFGWFMFMLRTVIQKAVIRLCGQTTSNHNHALLIERKRVKGTCLPAGKERQKMSGYIVLLLLIAFSPSLSSLHAQCALVCKSSVTVSLGANGSTTITPPMILQSSAGCSNNFSINVTDTLGNQFGNTVTAGQLGKKLTATITHPASGNSCSVSLTLKDDLPPVIDCSDTLFIWCNQPASPGSIGTPPISDNATPAASINIQYTDEFIDLVCGSMTNGIPVTAYIKRTWTAKDSSGNQSTCIQHIYMKRATLDMVVFPKHRDGTQAPALECAVDNPSNLSLTGQPTVENVILDNTTNCELVTSFGDQNIAICGGAKKVIRTWTVFDLCTENFRFFSQVIRVEDTQKPVITCPANATFNTYNSSCTAQVFLPQATATDACSGATVTTSWQYGTGNGPFNSIPVGTHTVTYTAKDGCNNTSTCQISIMVKDVTKPTVICQNQVNVRLAEDGTALVFAASFDNGSYDNCSIDHLEVKRDNLPFDEFISFDCNDLNKSIPVKLKVVDTNGLSNECTSNVRVVDDIKPSILCPPDITFSCGGNYNNPAQTGIPYATDNCTVASTDYTNEVNLNSCGIGTVTRIWKATDNSGNFSTCQQTISLTDNTPVSITFPADILTYECGPNTDPAVTGTPAITGKDCEQLQITNTDYLFYTAEPACFKLIRKWAIINWCVYQPNDPTGAGFWEHTQVIEVRDSIPPVVTCPADMTVGIQNTGCQTAVDVPLPQVNDCSNQITITNNSPFATSVNGKADGTYPKGTTTITYTAADGCGNTSKCSMKLSVVDARAPNPVCNNGVSVTIQQSGYVTVTPAMINNGSFDNCSATSKLVLQVSPNTFDCQSLGSKTVTLTVTDEGGNSAFCSTLVNVQDNFNVCNSQSGVTIAGKMTRGNGDPVAQKLVGLSGGLAIAVHTNVDGTYAFPNLPIGQSYTLTPSYNTKPLNGVTTFDMVVIRRHILGVEELGSPYKIIAADVNKSNSVSTLDLVEMQKLILNVTTQFPNNTPSWRFVDASYIFPDPKQPFVPPFPETISLSNLQANAWEKNFIGIKTGDVNDSAVTSNFEGDGDRLGDRSKSKPLTLLLDDVELVKGLQHVLPFKAKDFRKVAGFQFTVDFDEKALGFENVEPGALATIEANNFGTIHAGEGILTASWNNIADEELSDGETVFSLKFIAKDNIKLSDVIAVNSRLTPAEVYFGDMHASQTSFETGVVTLEFDNTPSSRIRLYQNAPNPFQTKTQVSFYLPEPALIDLRVYDVSGRLLKSYHGPYERGFHKITMDFSEDRSPGLLLCELSAKGFQTQSIKMLKN